MGTADRFRRSLVLRISAMTFGKRSRFRNRNHNGSEADIDEPSSNPESKYSEHTENKRVGLEMIDNRKMSALEFRTHSISVYSVCSVVPHLPFQDKSSAMEDFDHGFHGFTRMKT